MAKRAYIAVNGIGLGHARRSNRIGRMLKNEGYEILFSTYKGTSAEKFLREVGWRVVTVPELSWTPTKDGGIDGARTVLKVPAGVKIVAEHLSLEHKIIKNFAPDIVLSDMRLASVFVSKMLDIPCFFISLFLSMRRVPDNNLKPIARVLAGFIERAAKTCNKIFMTDFPPPWTIYYYFLPARIPSNMVFTGPIIDENIEREIYERDISEAKYFAKEELGLEGYEKTILFIPSGHEASQRFFLQNFLALIPFFKRKERIKFVLFKLGRSDKRRIRIRDNIEIINWIPNITDSLLSKYFLASDIIIGHYGMNKVFDAIAAGAVFAGVMSKNQLEQQGLATRVAELKLGFIIRNFRKEVPEIIELISENREYYRRVRAYGKMMKKYGALDIIKKEVESALG
ncbi:MAG: glycosyltransferase family protein [Candidatus Njordarchaeales archaeon]